MATELEDVYKRQLYTNIDQVEQVNRLHFYPDLTGYYQARIQRNIEVLEQEIAAEKAQIQELDEQIAAYQVQITQTSERMPYLSRQQRTDAENSIETVSYTHLDVYKRQPLNTSIRMNR